MAINKIKTSKVILLHSQNNKTLNIITILSTHKKKIRRSYSFSCLMATFLILFSSPLSVVSPKNSRSKHLFVDLSVGCVVIVSLGRDDELERTISGPLVCGKNMQKTF